MDADRHLNQCVYKMPTQTAIQFSTAHIMDRVLIVSVIVNTSRFSENKINLIC